MKFNWGTGIVIGIICFVAFILQYVLRVQFDSKYDNELVTENYYQKEVEIDANRLKTENALALGNSLRMEPTKEGLKIYFPEDIDSKQVKGTISLYRPSNQALDQTIQLELSSNYLLIPKSRLVDGRWDVTLSYVYNGKEYLKQQTLIL